MDFSKYICQYTKIYRYINRTTESEGWDFNACASSYVGWDVTKRCVVGWGGVGGVVGVLFEDVLEGGTFVGLEFLDGLFELFAGLVPLVDAREEVLLVHLAAHD